VSPFDSFWELVLRLTIFIDAPGCTPHRKRHTAHGSHLQEEDNDSRDHNERLPSPAAVNANQVQKDTLYRPSTGGHASDTNISTMSPYKNHSMASQLHVPTRMLEASQTTSFSATPSGSHMKSPHSINIVSGSDYATNMTTMGRSHSGKQSYGDITGAYGQRNLRNFTASNYNSSQEYGSYKSATPRKYHHQDAPLPPPPNSHLPTNPVGYRLSPMSTHNGHSAQNSIYKQQMQPNLRSDFHPPPLIPPMP
jgi:hypothetical protein